MFKSVDIGIDLGTANILVYEKDKGVVFSEPSVVALDKKNQKVLAIGHEARELLGRSPENIITVRPLREGVIAKYTITQRMLAMIIEKVCGRSLFFKPRVMVCVPVGITSVEKRAVLEAAMHGGASKTYLIEEPMAAALGAGVDIGLPRGNMVVDIGGGSTDVAILSLGGIVVDNSTRIGGDHFDEAIASYVKREKGVTIGERTAEEIKIKVATVSTSGRNDEIEVRGHDNVSGLPKTITVTSAECREALADSVQTLLNAVRQVLEKCPPELSADIIDNGIYLTGGGALLDGLATVLHEETKIDMHIASDPLNCVAIGTGIALRSLDMLHNGEIFTYANIASNMAKR
ncbi:MAG: rod shape-determining protein [Acidaminococcaceae bacterium]|nr:rod shape-determining protein [Acidaminococcaceae bacterium]MDO4935572.1 rod shape-determining protein [Phascolarctobacterium sp.]